MEKKNTGSKSDRCRRYLQTLDSYVEQREAPLFSGYYDGKILGVIPARVVFVMSSYVIWMYYNYLSCLEKRD